MRGLPRGVHAVRVAAQPPVGSPEAGAVPTVWARREAARPTAGVEVPRSPDVLVVAEPAQCRAQLLGGRIQRGRVGVGVRAGEVQVGQFP